MGNLLYHLLVIFIDYDRRSFIILWDMKTMCIQSLPFFEIGLRLEQPILDGFLPCFHDTYSINLVP